MQKIIFGIDEAGRGPLAGPVVACAITGPNRLSAGNKGLKIGDSKKLSQKQREAVYYFLKKSPDFHWRVANVGEKIIDKINILKASKLAMTKAILNLEKKINKKAGLLMIDGNFGLELARPQVSIISGDETEFLISLASIVAKVERDKLMLKAHQKYPMYGFDKHKGYGTKNHYQAINQYGPCPIHRISFRLTCL